MRFHFADKEIESAEIRVVLKGGATWVIELVGDEVRPASGSLSVTTSASREEMPSGNKLWIPGQTEVELKAVGNAKRETIHQPREHADER